MGRLFWLTVLALLPSSACAGQQSVVPGQTQASPTLQRDVFAAILLRERLVAPKCRHHQVVDTKVIVTLGDHRGVERWTLKRCGKRVFYRIEYWPGSQGGTDFAIMLEPAAGTKAPSRPVIERPILPLAGAEWVLRVRRSGSFGHGLSQRRAHMLGEQVWRGRRVLVVRFEDPDLPEVQYWTADGDVVARQFEFGTMIHEPPPARIHWPLRVGIMWRNRFRIYSKNGSSEVEETVVVGSYKDVTVPAGTFKCFEIARLSPHSKTMQWWSPKLGIVIKSQEKTASGSYSEELLWYRSGSLHGIGPSE